jgi:hypothetical protein
MATTKSFGGEFYTWTLGGSARRYAVVTMPYGAASAFIEAVRYNATNGRGEQREIVSAHCKNLVKAMKAGEYTPTPVSANLRESHLKALEMNEERGTFTLTVSDDDPLAQTDGGHRFEALATLRKEATDALKNEKDLTPEKKEELESFVQQVNDLPVTVTVYLDGDPKRDFVNLQLGRSVDSSHLLAMKIQQKLVDDPAAKVAFEVAKLLGKTETSPFNRYIRFDSRGVAPLPIATLCSLNSSDLGTSLVGLAKAAPNLKPQQLAQVVCKVYDGLRNKAPELLEYGKVLATLDQNGTRGSATMLVGLATCVAYRLHAEGRDDVTDADIVGLVDSARYRLDEKVNGNFSSGRKRELLGKFAEEFFETLEEQRHDGLPVGLLRQVSASAFGAAKLPASLKKAPEPAPEPAPEANGSGKKGKKKKKANLPDVDGPVAA